MKKILPLLILISSFTFGQGVNYEKGLNTDYNQEVAGITVFEDYTYVAENVSHASLWTSDAYISKVDTLGNQLWRVEALLGSNKEVVRISSIIATVQGGVLVNGSGMACCDCGGVYGFTEEFDVNGTSLWSEVHEGINSFSTCVYKNDSDIVYSVFNLAQLSKIYFKSLSSSLDSLELITAPILEVAQITNSSLLLRTSDSLFEYDFQGNVLNNKTFTSAITGLDKISNDSIVVLTNDSVFVLNSSFQNLFSGANSSYHTYNDLKIINGKVSFTGSNTQDSWLIKFNNNLQTDVVIGLPYSGNFNDVELDYSQSHFSLATNTSLTNYQSIRVIDYSLNRNTDLFVNNMDVSVIDVRINDASTLESSSTNSVYAVDLNVDVLVKNNSSTLVNECRINSLLGNSICNERYFTELKTGLSIGANDSVWIPLGWIGVGDYSLFETPISYIKCFYTSNPNGVVDLNVNNDSYCKSGVAGYVSLNENIEEVLSVFPNPVQDRLFINSELEITSVSLFNVNGQLIKSSYNTKSIDVSNLENGVYFIKATLEEGIINKRFIKTDL